MKNYQKPQFLTNDGTAEGVYAASGADSGSGSGADCLSATWWEDNPDGDTYRFVFKITHKGHQSYGQTWVAEFSTPVNVVETDGMVSYTTTGNSVKFFRNNQLNDNGLVEEWVKVKASTHPTILSVVATECKKNS